MLTLRDMRPGHSAQVLEIRSDNPKRLVKLSHYGLVPGGTVILLQRSPAFVIRVGETQLSLDDEIASEIFVK